MTLVLLLDVYGWNTLANSRFSNSVCNVGLNCGAQVGAIESNGFLPIIEKPRLGKLRIWEALLGPSSFSLLSSCLLILYVRTFQFRTLDLFVFFFFVEMKFFKELEHNISCKSLTCRDYLIWPNSLYWYLFGHYTRSLFPVCPQSPLLNHFI